MNFSGNLTSGVTITFTQKERAVIQRGLKREVRRRESTGLSTLTGAEIFTTEMTNVIESMVRRFLEGDKQAPLTVAEQATIDGIVETAAERDVSTVPLTTILGKSKRKAGKKKR